MRININIEKKHFYLIAVMIALVGVVSFVQSQGATFGHTAEVVTLDVGGTVHTVQDYINNDVCRVDGTNCLPTSIDVPSEHYVPVGIGNGNSNQIVKCPPGEIVTGFNYDGAGDDHINGFYCTPF